MHVVGPAPVLLQLIDGHGLISICQEHDIPALGTRKRRSRTGQCSDLAFSPVHAITARRLISWLPGRLRDLHSLNVMPLVCPADGALAQKMGYTGDHLHKSDRKGWR